MNEPLTCAMQNVVAGILGDVAREAGNPQHPKVGDSIDRGLILRRLLDEAGFEIRLKPNAKCGDKWRSMGVSLYD